MQQGTLTNWVGKRTFLDAGNSGHLTPREVQEIYTLHAAKKARKPPAKLKLAEAEKAKIGRYATHGTTAAQGWYRAKDVQTISDWEHRFGMLQGLSPSHPLLRVASLF
eukprot:TRINITY_DN6817_c1_g1_i5.p1 TRINITY_DN6817_c1_g1~~TRINITY_DN6817_c1_g1_i5.p1  ORF type:complete len:108 (-),score=14.39 TRINITY_DN6817_c1_g1_i5:63-386(-)